MLGELLRALDAIGHVRRVRTHTRMPLVLPERIDAGLLDAWSARLRMQRVMVRRCALRRAGTVARRLVADLSARLPGYLVPRLVREVPGAPAKEMLPPASR